MKKTLTNLAIIGFSILTICISTSASAQDHHIVKVGGEAMYQQKDIIDNAVNSKVHTTLVAAVKAAGLVETLKGKGPFTVFAPTDDAFENLPAGTVAMLLEPKNKATLQKILTYHVVAGNYDAARLSNEIKDAGGILTLKTVSGGTLKAWFNGPMNVSLMDENGATANISTYDVKQSNGVIHVIDAVVTPSN